MKRIIRSIENRIPARLRVFPDYLIVGAQKAGTTSLFKYLHSHPQVKRVRTKEINFFSKQYENGTNWYRSHFQSTPRRWFNRNIRRRNYLSGYASPNYLYLPFVPERVRAVLPEIRLIALVREPASRAYSAYMHNLRAGRKLPAFNEVIGREIEKYQKNPALVPRVSHLHRGLYADQIERWEEHFPREKLLVLHSRDLFSDPQATLDRVHAFLDLDPHQYAVTRLSPRNQKPYEPMDRDMRQTLQEFYQPHNRRLYEMLGRDLEW